VGVTQGHAAVIMYGCYWWWLHFQRQQNVGQAQGNTVSCLAEIAEVHQNFDWVIQRLKPVCGEAAGPFNCGGLFDASPSYTIATLHVSCL
jgi:hypothetical protein